MTPNHYPLIIIKKLTYKLFTFDSNYNTKLMYSIS